MPSPLVNRYSVYFHLADAGKVRQSIAKDPSLLMAVESCLAAYEATGHFGYVIEGERPRRVFTLDRKLLLALVFLRANDRAHYLEVLNRLDRSGDQDALESSLSDDAVV